MASYTPVDVAGTNEKDWAYKLGLLDWDKTKIVFTKRSLIDFLKHIDVTVDTNFSQLSKLPRYAEFGKVSGEASGTAAAPAQASASHDEPAAAAPADPSDPSWKPTRRVRTAPGGAQTFSFGGEPHPVNAAAAEAPPVPTQAPQPSAPAPVAQAPQPVTEPESEYRVVDNDGNTFKPTRRVRTNPGGHDSVHGLFGDF
ncbi:hypothetical protein BDV93DRAFT_517139 [Ceratobasidium sp. AG-I]|nr:hypothetical protein BDV93DRAFT_517139 [Ceratobasidium sp. AG-I]